MSRNQLQMILKINGYSEAATDDEIRAVLHNAKYSEAEIEQALRILRQQEVAPVIRSDGLHTVFYTDGRLRPSEIAGLLGIEVDFDVSHMELGKKLTHSVTPREAVMIIGLAMMVALLCIIAFMYINQIGWFY